jgi:hypothetical protein
MVLIPLVLSMLLLLLSDNHFTLWIYQAFAAIFLLGLLSSLDSEFSKRDQIIIYTVVATVVVGGSFLVGLEAVFFVIALIMGIGFVLGGFSALGELINPKPGTGSVLTAMFLIAPIALVVGCYYLAIGYQGLGLDEYLRLAQFIPMLKTL